MPPASASTLLEQAAQGGGRVAIPGGVRKKDKCGTEGCALEQSQAWVAAAGLHDLSDLSAFMTV